MLEHSVLARILRNQLISSLMLMIENRENYTHFTNHVRQTIRHCRRRQFKLEMIGSVWHTTSHTQKTPARARFLCVSKSTQRYGANCYFTQSNTHANTQRSLYDTYM